MIETHRVYLDTEEYAEFSSWPGRVLAIPTVPDSEVPGQVHIWRHVGHKFLNGDFSVFYHQYALVAAYSIVETMQ